MAMYTPEKYKRLFDATMGDLIACCHAQNVEFEIQ